jgi:hypothetical protein
MGLETDRLQTLGLGALGFLFDSLWVLGIADKGEFSVSNSMVQQDKASSLAFANETRNNVKEIRVRLCVWMVDAERQVAWHVGEVQSAMCREIAECGVKMTTNDSKVMCKKRTKAKWDDLNDARGYCMDI